MSNNKMSSDQYALQWCNMLMRGEQKQCQAGVEDARKWLNSGKTPAEVVNMGSNWGVADIPPGGSPYAATEGYRYGVYLGSAFNGNKDNLCTVDIQNAEDGKTVSMPYVCPSACDNIFTDGGAKKQCQAMAKSSFDAFVAQRPNCASDHSFSCVYGLTEEHKGMNCDTNPKDKEKYCVPTVVGCSLGVMESEMLHYVQQYQKDHKQPFVSCLDIANGKAAPNPMFPEGGNVYPDMKEEKKKQDENGGGGGSNTVTPSSNNGWGGSSNNSGGGSNTVTPSSSSNNGGNTEPPSSSSNDDKYVRHR
jgi:hypothetical protein